MSRFHRSYQLHSKFSPKFLEPLESRRLLSGNISLDNSWGGDGIVTEPADVDALAAPIAMATAPSGKVLAIATGAGRELIRYNADGTMDESFGVDGRFLLSFDARRVVVDSLDRVIVAGTNVVLRLSADGETDASFGTGGFVTLSSGGAFIVSTADLETQADNSITVLRSATLNGSGVNPNPAVVITHLTNEGDLDGSFGNRVTAIPLGAFFAVTTVEALALADADDVLVGGAGVFVNNTNVIRFNSFGIVDFTFKLTVPGNGVAMLDSIDTDSFGGITLLSHRTLVPDVAEITQFGADELLIDQFSLFVANQSTIRSLDVEGPKILVGFEPYAIARLVTGQVSNGIFVDEAGQLSVIGTAGNDTILINRSDSQLRITRNGKRTLIDRSGITSILLTGNAGHDSMTVTVDIPTVATGGTGNDTITSAGAIDRLSGEDGNDIVIGNGGHDQLLGGVGADRLYGYSGKDKMAGEGGKDRLYGGSGDDQIDGGASDDQLFGEAGNDKLFGGRGNDTLSGGSGVNQYFPGDGSDIIVSAGLVPASLVPAIKRIEDLM